MMKVLDLFSGIGGFSLGLERTGGFETVAFCEIDPFCRRVLAKHWPGVPIHDDVRTLTADAFPAGGVDVICGGFPCQDVSHAGKRAGLEGARSGLWSEYARLIGELRPSYVIVENVPGLLSLGLGAVLGDLAALRYDAVWDCIPASAVGAPHLRDRVWILAQPQYSDADNAGSHRATEHVERNAELRHEQKRQPRQVRKEVADANSAGRARPRSTQPKGRQRDLVIAGGSQALADTYSDEQHGRSSALQVGRSRFAREAAFDGDAARIEWRVEPNVGRVADGVPARVDRLRSLGNAVVPQIPELIGNAILSALDLKAAHDGLGSVQKGIEP